MAHVSLQRNMESKGPGRASLIRCPHCLRHFADGGEVDETASEFDREHEEEMSFGRETDAYDEEFDHYYGEGEAGFARGGRVERKPVRRDRQGLLDRVFSRRTAKPPPPSDTDAFSMEDERTPSMEDYRKGFYADGGRVDGSGKVDGIHIHPSECSHMASGGVCRHLPSSRRGPGNAGDDHVRNFSSGGAVDSFPGFLAMRRKARGSRHNKGA